MLEPLAGTHAGGFALFLGMQQRRGADASDPADGGFAPAVVKRADAQEL